jgi:hypothetical protein
MRRQIVPVDRVVGVVGAVGTQSRATTVRTCTTRVGGGGGEHLPLIYGPLRAAVVVDVRPVDAFDRAVD